MSHPFVQTEFSILNHPAIWVSPGMYPHDLRIPQMWSDLPLELSGSSCFWWPWILCSIGCWNGSNQLRRWLTALELFGELCWSWMLAKSMKSELLWDTMYLLCTNTIILMVGLKFDSNAGPDGLGCATLEIQRPRWQCRGTMKWNAKETPELSWYSHRRWSSGHPGHPPPKNLF
jgi:hypothetical protein